MFNSLNGLRTLLVCALLAPCFATAAERPNIVLMLSDNLGYGDDRLPINQGFDEWWGFPFSTDVSWFPDAGGNRWRRSAG